MFVDVLLGFLRGHFASSQLIKCSFVVTQCNGTTASIREAVRGHFTLMICIKHIFMQMIQFGGE